MVLPRKPHTFRNRFLRVTLPPRTRYVDNGFVSQKFSPPACSPQFTGGEPLTSDIELRTTDKEQTVKSQIMRSTREVATFFPIFSTRYDGNNRRHWPLRNARQRRCVPTYEVRCDRAIRGSSVGAGRWERGLIFAGEGYALGQTIEARQGSLAASSQSTATAAEENAVAGRLPVAETVLGFNLASFSEFR
jgi:hypothetical protein